MGLPSTLSTLLRGVSESPQRPLLATTPALTPLWEQASAYLAQHGLPTKAEAYRFVRLQEVFQQELYLPDHLEDVEYAQLPLLGFKIAEEGSYRLQCINGRYNAPVGERLTRLPSGVVYGSLAQALREEPELVRQHLAPATEDSLEALSTLLATDGVFLYVPRGVVVEKPFHIELVHQGPRSLLVNQRHLVVLEAGAVARCFVSEHSLSEARFVSNALTEVRLGDSAHLSWVSLQNVHNATTLLHRYQFHLEAHAVVDSHTLTLRGGFVRNAICADLEGEHAELRLSGLALIDAGQYVDTVTHVDHRVPNGVSSQLFKTLVDKGGEYSFFGHIHVHRDAQKTQAYQRNANVLVEAGGVVHTRPQLLIDADDVKCSHGATVGHLDEEARFYMLTRGIPEKQVRQLLMRAFLQDVISALPYPALQEQVETLIEARLRGEKK